MTEMKSRENKTPSIRSLTIERLCELLDQAIVNGDTEFQIQLAEEIGRREIEKGQS